MPYPELVSLLRSILVQIREQAMALEKAWEETPQDFAVKKGQHASKFEQVNHFSFQVRVNFHHLNRLNGPQNLIGRGLLPTSKGGHSMGRGILPIRREHLIGRAILLPISGILSETRIPKTTSTSLLVFGQRDLWIWTLNHPCQPRICFLNLP